jgi:hypothetical protein
MGTHGGKQHLIWTRHRGESHREEIIPSGFNDKWLARRMI